MSLINEALKRAEADKLKRSPYFDNLTVLPAGEDDGPPPPAPPPEPTPPRKGFPVMLLVSILLLLAAAGGGVLLLLDWRAGGGPQSADAAQANTAQASESTKGALPSSRPAGPPAEVLAARGRSLEDPAGSQDSHDDLRPEQPLHTDPGRRAMAFEQDDDMSNCQDGATSAPAEPTQPSGRDVTDTVRVLAAAMMGKAASAFGGDGRSPRKDTEPQPEPRDVGPAATSAGRSGSITDKTPGSPKKSPQPTTRPAAATSRPSEKAPSPPKPRRKPKPSPTPSSAASGGKPAPIRIGGGTNLSGLHVSAIIRGPDGNMALINGGAYREGQSIRGARIVEIGAYHVVLVGPGGKRVTLRM